MKLLLLTSSTGGGHDMRASSFERWAKHPDASEFNIETERMQVLEATHPTYNFGVSLYNWIQLHAPWLHHLYFSYLEQAGMHLYGNAIMGREKFEQKLKEIKPDVIVSTHAHLNHGFFSIAKAVLGKSVRCITYCGELYGGYGFSRHWVNPRSDLFIGAVRETCLESSRHRMISDKNWVGGFMLNPGFYEKPMEADERRTYIMDELGMDPERFILLLATGANSANNHMNLIRELYKSGSRVQVVALCGRNKMAKKEIEQWAAGQDQLTVKALPYYSEMFRLLQSVSAIVARPGTGTTSEAILSGCPVIFNGIGGIMPQEYITVKFARAHGFGKVMMRPSQLSSCVEGWLDNKVLDEQKRCMLAVRPERSPLDILRKIST